jgi:hypothetical protein
MRLKRTRKGGSPWTYQNWPYQHNAVYYPLNSYGGQVDRMLRITNVGGTRKRKRR